MKKRALISVSDKSGLIDFARFLEKNNYELISTGGTFKHLKDAGLSPIQIDEVTNFPEMLDGRVKTLHPKVHGGILAIRSNEEHMKTVQEHGIGLIDMVIVNLYPFFENADKEISLEEKVEFIDIGGPSMLRSAAKGFFDVTVITDASDYAKIQEEIETSGNTQLETRKMLAGKVFNLTAAYDAAISKMLLDEEYPNYLNASFKKVANLRYGENPHQSAAYYVSTVEKGAMKDFEQLGGKELSFNNLRDMDLCWKVVNEFKEEMACCAVKHSTPCGVAVGTTPGETYRKTFECDPVSIFGGIVGMNFKVDAATATALNETFLEIVMAPDFDADALEILNKKKNLRVIKIKHPVSDKQVWVKIDGGMLVQNADDEFSEDISVVTEKQPTDEQRKALIFSQRVVKYVKSNAIVVSNGQQALGIGGGQVNRIWATQHAVERAKAKFGGELVLASDAFFPFRDVVDFCAAEGIKAIIQPGGSMRDEESIQAANEHEIPMLFTGMRHFFH
ncbi:bifunctional phosphoribosylaminoimidazolecarboxamide formyltransferase/IMP cyclohydrolase [Elizabethkingia anophelis]|uniref:bifunctional phosphoribosylaminoimidazolecarboxamide formyltransferase/IMP cyclohydrolase n=1 Tax=Elizabethkingia anophelis TaxID=1117645 RepID=UPI00099A13D2|nr:bifunctional phosphoribosylaminoimidazolecarboxamide formyltransferase/IMP cyclohydrolase [Elizabethkingia anophelis]MCT4012371.1 bifunctional phosphoribosylaminoimidazolecarboxamide formyltransferase/IMP cyclohydrolase [Elizabethkingia anophelis]MDV3741522.1 bifunctional phosphoribosylaminoimidazolecarboxamide formyltransferase/IMP cyclohydrolase PurH [Elizabethkingia anophelis]MDV3759479.1 bifunctional phosphoribosylaminoimidazolecarboxamide formyltransferase/IMP cyclohydrolase PurH [Elizab